MRSARKTTALLALLLFFCGSTTLAAKTAQPDTARAMSGVVVADDPLAAQAGLEILQQGGNAVDAAVAVAFALAVTHPQAGNLGGGGFMLIRLGDGRSIFVDYRETAPAAARWNMYLDPSGKLIPEATTTGWLSAGVPGTVAGLDVALRTYGTLSLAQVLQPAIRLAEKGFPVNEPLATSLAENAHRLSHDPASRRIFLHGGRPLKPGELLVQKDLARTLRTLARGGAREFYQGALARRLVRESKKAGGLFTLDDLHNYRAVLRQPLRGSFRGYEILTAPPPSSGGVALLETLNMLEPLLTPADTPESPETIHVIVEALRRAFADRARYLADADFAPVPVAGLTDKRYAAAFAASINRQHASVSAQLERPDPLRFQAAAPAVPTATGHGGEGENTTHFSVMDSTGNAVANTYTLNDSYGSATTVPGLGFLLNNTMDDFTTQPGEPNVLFGLVQSDANKIAPGKRPLSSMMPTIILRDGHPFLVLGSPGGPRIISGVVEVLLNRLVFGDDLALAVARPRFHHQWLPDTLVVEPEVFTEAQLEALRARGHHVDFRGTVGRVNAIERDPATGELYGVGDARGGGVARGY